MPPSAPRVREVRLARLELKVCKARPDRQGRMDPRVCRERRVSVEPQVRAALPDLRVRLAR